jgi:hypothetical protein
MTNQAENLPIDTCRVDHRNGPRTAYSIELAGSLCAPYEVLKEAECDALLLAAERELGAFQAAVRSMFGPDAALRAANHWLDALETSEPVLDATVATLRRVTIQAASRVAREQPVEAQAGPVWRVVPPSQAERPA